jgi:hypothetical protein
VLRKKSVRLEFAVAIYSKCEVCRSQHSSGMLLVHENRFIPCFACSPYFSISPRVPCDSYCLGTRSSAALKAEKIFLRKQLARDLAREIKPGRANDAIRLSMVLGFSRGKIP